MRKANRMAHSIVSVVVPAYNEERTIGDVIRSTASAMERMRIPFEIIVVDDGQNAPSLVKARDRFPELEVLGNPHRLGFSGSCNRGLEAAETRYAVLLNDDTRVTDGWLRPLIEAAEADATVAACQPKLLSATRPGYFDYGGGAGGYIDR